MMFVSRVLTDGLGIAELMLVRNIVIRISVRIHIIPRRAWVSVRMVHWCRGVREDHLINNMNYAIAGIDIGRDDLGQGIDIPRSRLK